MPEPGKMPLARDVMTHEVVTVRLSTSVPEAMELLLNHNITGLPVLDDRDQLAGIVSESDFIGKRGERVEQIMTRAVISADPAMDLEKVAELLLRKGIRRVPIVEAGKLVGLISRRDMLTFLARTVWVCKMCGLETHALNPPGTCKRCQAEASELRSAAIAP